MALAAAALSSLLALVELSLRVATDSGLASRNVALACVTGVLFVVATPSALSMQFLINQDYVWGIALILSGLFFSLLIIQYGVEKFREDYLVANHENDWVVGRWWIYIMKFVIPVEVAILLGWWVVIVPITSGAKRALQE
jgi:NSS family neurotransmitter:Na+ symporter